MIIEIKGAYADGIYCEIIQDGKITYVYGFDNIKKAVDEARKRNEQVEFRNRKILEDCLKINKLLENGV